MSIDGIEPDGQLRLRVHNGSDRVLSRFTIGVRYSEPAFEGAIPLDVSKIEPGETAMITSPAYQTLAAPENVELRFDEPTPADREWYRELA